MAQSFPPSPGSAGPPQAPEPPRRSTARIVVTVGVVLALVVVVAVVAGVVVFRSLHDSDGPASSAEPPPPASTSNGPMPSYEQSLRRYYTQELRWRDCGRSECTRLTVPLDYAQPDGETLKLAVLRVPAEERSRRKGQLLVNPGGPGGSSLDYASGGTATFGEIARFYDIVGMDPRGVGESQALECEGTAGRDEFLAADASPDTPAEEDRYDGLVKRFGDACLSKSGSLAEHMSTVEVAKDIDILRAALGEAKLDYHGASYGTFIGATYADLFPSHVHRMVLDGAIDPSLSTVQLSLGQAGGFQVALNAYLDDCLQNNCPLGDDRSSALARITQLLDDLDAEPMPTDDDDRPLTEGLATFGIIFPLYLKELWPELSDAFAAAIQEGDGSRLLALSDAYNSRGANGYTDNSTNALYAVNCLDHDDFVPSDQVSQYVDEFEKVAPTFARWFAYGLSTCQPWPVQSGNVTKAMAAEGAPPIVVVGTTRDPATPYAWSVALAKQLSSGRLISRDGDGHTGFRRGNECVDDALYAYWLRGTVPRDGLRC